MMRKQQVHPVERLKQWRYIAIALCALVSWEVMADGHETSTSDAADAYLRALEGGSLPPPPSTTSTPVVAQPAEQQPTAAEATVPSDESRTAAPVTTANKITEVTNKEATRETVTNVTEQVNSPPQQVKKTVVDIERVDVRKPTEQKDAAMSDVSQAAADQAREKFVPSPLPPRPASSEQPAQSVEPTTQAPATSSGEQDDRYVAMFCTAGTIDRTVSVEYDNPDRPVPCRVRYHKPTEGKTEFPWRAANSIGYCEQKADGLVAQLRGYGWRCTPLSDQLADQSP